jgi:hypothetical protein
MTFQDFTPYVALAVILYAIRQTKKVPNAYIPSVAIVLGVLYSFWEAGKVNPTAFINGIQYALYGIGTVASIKYFLQTKKEQ